MIMYTKDASGESRVKATVVVTGFEEEAHHIRIDSRIGGKEILRIFLFIMTSKNWELYIWILISKLLSFKGKMLRYVFLKHQKKLIAMRKFCGSLTNIFAKNF